jgi:hypothetical protein
VDGTSIFNNKPARLSEAKCLRIERIAENIESRPRIFSAERADRAKKFALLVLYSIGVLAPDQLEFSIRLCLAAHACMTAATPGSRIGVIVMGWYPPTTSCFDRPPTDNRCICRDHPDGERLLCPKGRTRRLRGWHHAVLEQ